MFGPAKERNEVSRLSLLVGTGPSGLATGINVAKLETVAEHDNIIPGKHLGCFPDVSLATVNKAGKTVVDSEPLGRLGTRDYTCGCESTNKENIRQQKSRFLQDHSHVLLPTSRVLDIINKNSQRQQAGSEGMKWETSRS
jgi:hypothetical protein